MDYTELLAHLNKTLDDQTAQRLAESIMDAGGVDSVISLLEETR
jgi:hypothetical protein